MPEAIVPEPAFEIFRVRHRGRRRPAGAGDAAARTSLSRSTRCSRRSRRDTRVVFLTNPNNPTGVSMPLDAIRTIARRVPPDAVVFVDEAYAEFAGDDVHPRAADVSRTSSSAARSRRRSAWPGCGSAADRRARRARSDPRGVPVYSVNIAAVVAVQAALEDRDYLHGLPAPGRANRRRCSTPPATGSASSTGRAPRTSCWSAPAIGRAALVQGRRRRAASTSAIARPSRAAPAASASRTGIVEHTRRVHRRDGRGPVRRARDRSADHRNADRAERSRSTARAATSVRTGIRFLDHMLELFARHGGFDLRVDARPAISTSISITPSRISASRSARRCRRRSATARGINRAGYFVMPMDETLAVAAIDLGGRPHAVVDLKVQRRARRRSADRAGARLLRGLRDRRARQRARQGAVRPLEPSQDRSGVQGVRARAARRLREGQAARADAAEHQGAAVIALIDYKARQPDVGARRRSPRSAPTCSMPAAPERARASAAASSCPASATSAPRARSTRRGSTAILRARRRRTAAARHLPRHAVAVRGQRRSARLPGTRPARRAAAIA